MEGETLQVSPLGKNERCVNNSRIWGMARSPYMGNRVGDDIGRRRHPHNRCKPGGFGIYPGLLQAMLRNEASMRHDIQEDASGCVRRGRGDAGGEDAMIPWHHRH